jgi:hypothetical protein
MEGNSQFEFGQDLAHKIPHWIDTAQGLPQEVLSHPEWIAGSGVGVAALAGATVATPRLARKGIRALTADPTDLVVGHSLQASVFAGRPPVRLRWADRRTGMRITGPTGSGKTSATVPFALDDLMAGRDVFCLEIHGDLGKTLIQYARQMGIETHLCDASEDDSLYWNPLAGEDTEDVSNRVAAAIASSMYYHGFYGPMGESAARNFTHLARDYTEHVLGRDPSTTTWDTLRDLLTKSGFLHQVLNTKVPDGSKRLQIRAKWVSDSTRAWFEDDFFAQTENERNRNLENVKNLFGMLDHSRGAKHILYPSPGQGELDLYNLLQRPSGGMGRLIVVRAPVQAQGMNESAGRTIAYMALKTMRDATLARAAPEEPAKPLSIFLDEMPSLIGQAGEETQREVAGWLTLVRDKNCAPHLSFQSHALMPQILRDALDATCRNFLVLGGSSPDEVERIRKASGIEETTTSDTRVSHSRGGRSVSEGSKETEKARLSFDEVKFLRRGQAIFLGVDKNADQLPVRIRTRRAQHVRYRPLAPSGEEDPSEVSGSSGKPSLEEGADSKGSSEKARP